MTTKQSKNSRKPKARETHPPALIAYHVAERGGKSFWTRIGAAWDHEDAKGLTLQLELTPVGGGRIVLREPNGEESTGEGRARKRPFFAAGPRRFLPGAAR
jgi:hypothetical protein